MYASSRKENLMVVAGLMVVCIAVVQAKPFGIVHHQVIPKNPQEDPLMAMPSQTHHIVEQTSQQQQPQQEIHYVYHTVAAERAHEEPRNEYQHQQQQQHVATSAPNDSGRDDHKQQYQLVQVSHEQGAQQDCQRKQEYLSMANLNGAQPSEEHANADQKNDGYTGEVLYVGQNGEIVNSPQSGYKVQGAAQQHNQESNTESGSSSALPATILTEVPAKDMPYDVLERLKKEFGVKVIATRERPGANLIINCDEYANPENTICARSPMFSTGPAVGQSYSYQPATHNDEQNGNQDHRVEHQAGGDASGYVSNAAPEPQPVEYGPHEAVSYNGPARVYEQSHEAYQTRSTVPSEQSERDAQAAPPNEQNGQTEQPQGDRVAEGSGEQQQASFDDHQQQAQNVHNGQQPKQAYYQQ